MYICHRANWSYGKKSQQVILVATRSSRRANLNSVVPATSWSATLKQNELIGKQGYFFHSTWDAQWAKLETLLCICLSLKHIQSRRELKKWCCRDHQLSCGNFRGGQRTVQIFPGQPTQTSAQKEQFCIFLDKELPGFPQSFYNVQPDTNEFQQGVPTIHINLWKGV